MAGSTALRDHLSHKCGSDQRICGGDWMQFLACFQADFIKTEWRMYD